MGGRQVLLLIVVVAVVLYFQSLDKKDVKQTRAAVKGIQVAIDKKVREGEKTAGKILGATTAFVQKQASQAASFAADAVFKNAVQSITQQIKKLPKEQQSEIRRNVCK